MASALSSVGKRGRIVRMEHRLGGRAAGSRRRAQNSCRLPSAASIALRTGLFTRTCFNAAGHDVRRRLPVARIDEAAVIGLDEQRLVAVRT